MRREKYLIETSSIRPALGSSTPAHCRHFDEQTQDGRLWTSTYIRMEFIRRWFCDMIRLALTIEQCSSVSGALFLLEQDFSPRRVKGILAGVAQHLQETGAIWNTRAAAEEVATEAMHWLKQFDKVFPARLSNLCKCQIGGKTPRVAYNHLLDDLHAFHESFMTPVTDCEVNDFLRFDRPSGRARTLLNDGGVRSLAVGKNLMDLSRGNTWITCKECSAIGDAIIALEQPASCCLVHLDGSFNTLCSSRKRRHKQIRSITAVEREARRPE
jgi:hypothetical protein